MNKRECETCIKRKTIYCPNSNKCLETENMPYYQNRIMLLEENQKYKEVINKAIKWVRDYMNEWDVDDEVYHDLNDLLILLEEVEHEKLY